ncbi:MAG: helix-turn-helix domain-containing protein [Arenimonas sp.]
MSAGWQVRWRLGELLDAQPELSAAELQRRLVRDGAHVITRSHLSRLARHPPESTPIALIGSLCRALGCTPNDLLGWSPPPAVERRPRLAAIRALAKQAATKGRQLQADAIVTDTPPLDETTRRRLVGPRVGALPAHRLMRKLKDEGA